MDITDKLMDLMQRPEALCNDLIPHLTDGPFGKMIHHPLLIDHLFDETKCALVNKRYMMKKDRLEEMIAERSWGSVLGLTERPYRINALLDLMERGLCDDPAEYWKQVGWVWTDSENIYECADDWTYIWEQDIGDRHLVMDADDRAVLASLPSVVTIWRGVPNPGTRLGMSWTIDEAKAKWFADRWQGNGSVVEKTIKRENIIAYFSNRSESEVVIFPDDLL